MKIFCMQGAMTNKTHTRITTRRADSTDGAQAMEGSDQYTIKAKSNEDPLLVLLPTTTQVFMDHMGSPTKFGGVVSAVNAFFLQFHFIVTRCPVPQNSIRGQGT